jgi:hypothetical protein
MLILRRYIKEADALSSAIAEIDKTRPIGWFQRDKVVEKRREELDTQRTTTENQIRENIEPYSRAICQPFCKKVVEALPRELRDQIYEYMITPDYVYVGPQYLANQGRPCENDKDAHFWDASYVGETMSVELAQTWYRLSLFYFWNKTKNVEVIKEFMASDRWNLGIKPNEHISRVRFDLGDEKFHRSNCRRGVVTCEIEGYSTRMLAPLKSLSQYTLPQRVRFLIRIHTLGSLENHCLTNEMLQDTLDEVIVELTALRSISHSFTIQWSEVGNLEFSSSDATMSTGVWKREIQNVSMAGSGPTND